MKQKKLQYEISCKQDITDQRIKDFYNLINIITIKLGVHDKLQSGERDQIVSHLRGTYPQGKNEKKIYNHNYYYTMAYNKLLYILYKKNRHVSFTLPETQNYLNQNIDIFLDQYQQDNAKKSFAKFLSQKMIELNSKFNKSYYLIIIRRICQYLNNPLDAPLKRRDLIKQISQNRYRNGGKKIPKNYVYRVFYVLKKNFKKWKKQYTEQVLN